ncbi:hypothetical protein CIHG_07751 [Coccidioides immitis H538.4]|uniref:Uncharacterized protein n=1 Tax=Coccidioides immitis H538.4 TaxID=396776 RepID=A0A0J8S003_COCIT|nr:hypothetical protein CIHG_07751 [Coccidioides immitis H538.4]
MSLSGKKVNASAGRREMLRISTASRKRRIVKDHMLLRLTSGDSATGGDFRPTPNSRTKALAKLSLSPSRA